MVTFSICWSVAVSVAVTDDECDSKLDNVITEIAAISTTLSNQQVKMLAISAQMNAIMSILQSLDKTGKILCILKFS